MNITHKEDLRNMENIASKQAVSLYYRWTAIYSALLAILIALVIGGAIRLFYVAHADFPLNDGGLFYTMTEDLRADKYVLPFYTSYNGGSIPYAYPPLAFYLSAAL